MNEYTFLTSNGYRTRHVHAHTLIQAAETVMYYYKDKSPEREKMGAIYLDQYQIGKLGDFQMSGWKQSQDKRLKGKEWPSDEALTILQRI